MLRRRVVGRALVRTAAVGGVAYAAGHHVAAKSAQQQQMDAQQNAQISDLQQRSPTTSNLLHRCINSLLPLHHRLPA
jgi:hypothetical protein